MRDCTVLAGAQAPDEARIVDFVNTFTRFLFQTELLEPVHVGNCLDFFQRCLNYSLMSPGEQTAFDMARRFRNIMHSQFTSIYNFILFAPVDNGMRIQL